MGAVAWEGMSEAEEEEEEGRGSCLRRNSLDVKTLRELVELVFNFLSREGNAKEGEITDPPPCGTKESFHLYIGLLTGAPGADVHTHTRVHEKIQTSRQNPK